MFGRSNNNQSNSTLLSKSIQAYFCKKKVIRAVNYKQPIEPFNITNLYLQTRNGNIIGSYFINETDRNQKCILIIHGRSTNRYSFTKRNAVFIKTMVDLNYCIAIPDVRGFGDSYGVYDKNLVCHDIEAVVEYLRCEVVVIGYGFGASVALAYASRKMYGNMRIEGEVIDENASYSRDDIKRKINDGPSYVKSGASDSVLESFLNVEIDKSLEEFEKTPSVNDNGNISETIRIVCKEKDPLNYIKKDEICALSGIDLENTAEENFLSIEEKENKPNIEKIMGRDRDEVNKEQQEYNEKDNNKPTIDIVQISKKSVGVSRRRIKTKSNEIRVFKEYKIISDDDNSNGLNAAHDKSSLTNPNNILNENENEENNSDTEEYSKKGLKALLERMKLEGIEIETKEIEMSLDEELYKQENSQHIHHASDEHNKTTSQASIYKSSLVHDPHQSLKYILISPYVTEKDILMKSYVFKAVAKWATIDSHIGNISHDNLKNILSVPKENIIIFHGTKDCEYPFEDGLRLADERGCRIYRSEVDDYKSILGNVEVMKKIDEFVQTG